MITYSFKLGKIHGRELKEGLHEVSQRPLMRAAKLIQRAIQGSMRKAPRPGVPSRPGTPPHVQSGTLRADISILRRKQADGGYTVYIGFTKKAWYGIVHERGGRFHPARPFIAPAWKKEARRIKHQFRNLPLAQTAAIRRLNSRSFRRQTP